MKFKINDFSSHWLLMAALCRCRRQFISINQSIFEAHRNSAALNKQLKSTQFQRCKRRLGGTVVVPGVAAVIIINYLSSLRFLLENNNSPAYMCERHESAIEKRGSSYKNGMGHILSCFHRTPRTLRGTISFPLERVSRMENILMSLYPGNGLVGWLDGWEHTNR